MGAADDLVTLQAQRDALYAALGSGEHVIMAEGKRVEYRSVSEIRDALKQIELQIGQLSGTVRRRVVFTDAPNQGGWRGTGNSY